MALDTVTLDPRTGKMVTLLVKNMRVWENSTKHWICKCCDNEHRTQELHDVEFLARMTPWTHTMMGSEALK
jgi:hypothetical protein